MKYKITLKLLASFFFRFLSFSSCLIWRFKEICYQTCLYFFSIWSFFLIILNVNCGFYTKIIWRLSCDKKLFEYFGLSQFQVTWLWLNNMANDFAAPMSSKELVTFTLSEVILPTVDIYTDFALAFKASYIPSW